MRLYEIDNIYTFKDKQSADKQFGTHHEPEYVLDTAFLKDSGNFPVSDTEPIIKVPPKWTSAAGRTVIAKMPNVLNSQQLSILKSSDYHISSNSYVSKSSTGETVLQFEISLNKTDNTANSRLLLKNGLNIFLIGLSKIFGNLAKEITWKNFSHVIILVKLNEIRNDNVKDIIRNILISNNLHIDRDSKIYVDKNKSNIKIKITIVERAGNNSIRLIARDLRNKFGDKFIDVNIQDYVPTTFSGRHYPEGYADYIIRLSN